MRGGLRHASRPARGAEPASLATERQELVVATVGAAQAQKAVCQDAALQEGNELVFDELRQAGTDGPWGLGEEAHDAEVPRRECLSVGCVHGSLLVADQHVAQAWLSMQSVVQRQHCTAGIAKNGVDAAGPACLQEDARAIGRACGGMRR